MRTRHALVTVAALSALALAGCEKSAMPGTPLAPGDASGAAAAGQASGGQAAGGVTKQDTPAAVDPKALMSNAAKTSKDASSYQFEWKMDDKTADGAGQWTSSGTVDSKSGKSKVDTVMTQDGKQVK